MSFVKFIFGTFAIIPFVSALCPGIFEGTPQSDYAETPSLDEYILGLETLNIKSVFEDIYDLLIDSQECWPADTLGGETNYGGLFIRLAWHCSGTFRDNDNKGGCAGGRQRFSPEASWEDNTNLDKARALLYPIKQKYGNALSWGDLMIFAGTASILHMGGPVTQVCGGRIDDVDGSKSIPLNNLTDCGEQGNCQEPIGASTIGLIYVNPEGVNKDPIPSKSAVRIREIFGRMGMNDSETVALIGGGHAFGKCHGACKLGPGDPPNKNSSNPWNGKCGGDGKGINTFTSGLEGQWTTKPFQWDNEYFTFLVNDKYNLVKSPADMFQWINPKNGYIMLTTDLALIEDDKYLEIVTLFANDINELNKAFSHAWEKLTIAGENWVEPQYRVCVDASTLIDMYSDEPTMEPTTEPTIAPTNEGKSNLPLIYGLTFGILSPIILIIVVFVICDMKSNENCVCCGITSSNTSTNNEEIGLTKDQGIPQEITTDGGTETE